MHPMHAYCRYTTPRFIKFIMTFFRLKFHSKKFYSPISIFFLLFLAKLAKRCASSRALNKIFFDASASSWKDFFVPNGKISLLFPNFDMPNIGVLILLSRKTLETPMLGISKLGNNKLIFPFGTKKF